MRPSKEKAIESPILEFLVEMRRAVVGLAVDRALIDVAVLRANQDAVILKVAMRGTRLLILAIERCCFIALFIRVASHPSNALDEEFLLANERLRFGPLSVEVEGLLIRQIDDTMLTSGICQE